MSEKEDHIKGRGAQKHSLNRFSSQHYGRFDKDGIDEYLPVDSKTTYYHDKPKKVVNKVTSPDLPMDYSMNPYQGCEHGCTYCYARNSHEFWGFNAGLDFESKIIIKENAAEVLEKQLSSKKWVPKPIMLSGNTDCYQPIERKKEITRSLLKVFLKFKHPVGIITKNELILRDLDLLQELNKYNLIRANISITTLNEALRRQLEPRTSTSIKRIQTVHKLSEGGIPVNVMMAPIIPSLNSMEIPEIMKTVSEAGAHSASYTIVRLNGAIAEIFEDWLLKTYSDRAQKILNQISECHGGDLNDTQFGRRMRGEGEIAASINRLFNISRKKYFKNIVIPPLETKHFKSVKNSQLKLF